MMHSLDEDGTIVKVNRHWLRRLGYKREDALGRKSVEFITEPSRAWAAKDTLPLFWRVGSARSVGYQFLTKRGRVLNVLLDADACLSTTGGLQSYAALRDHYNLVQWEQSSTTIRTLRQLSDVRSDLESVLHGKGSNDAEPDLQVVQRYPDDRLQAGPTGEALATLLELTQNISASLRDLVRPAGGVAGFNDGAAARDVASGEEHR